METNIFVDILQCFDTAVWAYCTVLFCWQTKQQVLRLSSWSWITNQIWELLLPVSRCVCFSVLFCL